MEFEERYRTSSSFPLLSLEFEVEDFEESTAFALSLSLRSVNVSMSERGISFLDTSEFSADVGLELAELVGSAVLSVSAESTGPAELGLLGSAELEPPETLEAPEPSELAELACCSTSEAC